MKKRTLDGWFLVIAGAGFLGLFVLLIGLISWGANALNCYNYSNNTGRTVKSSWAGCYIKLNDNWYHIDQVRVSEVIRVDTGVQK